MSELIDSIFDVAKISDEIKSITVNLDGLKSNISNFSADVKKLYEAARGAKTVDDLAKNTKAVNDAMVQGSAVVSEYEKQQKRLQIAQEKLNVINSDANKALIRINLTTQERNALLKAEAVLSDANAGSLEKLAAQNKILAIEKRKLNLETEEGTKRLKEIIEAENANNKALKVGQNEDQKRIASIGEYKKQIGELFQGFVKGEIGTKQLANGFLKLGKQMIVSFVTNPVFLALGAIVILIKGVVDAIGKSEERTNKMKEAFARFQPILRTIGDGFEFLADAVIKTVGFLGKAFSAVTEFLGINPKGSADAFVQAEKSKQKAILETRKLNEDVSIQEAIIAEQREILADKENYTYQQRVEALKKAGEAEKQLSLDRQRIAELNLKALEEEAALDDNDAAMNDKLSAAIVAVNKARTESANIGRKLAKEQEKLSREYEADMKAEAEAAKAAAKAKEDAAKEAARKLIEEDRRLKDSMLAIMEEGEAKQIAMNAESFRRKIEDLKAAGQLTAELQKNLETANAIEVQKIRDDFAKKRVDEEKKAQDERNMLIDKQIADFEKNMQREVDALSASYREKELILKAEYAKGKISREQYEADLIALQSEALKEVNDKTIKSLQKELEIVELSADKRAEISAKIRDLQIQNENASLDATIDANQKKIDADKEAFNKRLQIAEQLSGAGMELFAAVSDFQAQEYEKRMAEIDALQEKNDEYFDKQQKNLDNAIMSEESRFLAQKKIDEDREKREKAIAERKRAEELRRAKWEKAQAVTSAVISTALATIKAFVDPGGVLGAVFAVLAAATGAAQIATILSRPIPAYKDGGITGSGLALWGEERPEVAVTRAGHVMYAERPTLQNFDAGTRIYKSVEDFERNIASGGAKSFEFDYDKMASKLPSTNITLDSQGLWGIVRKEQSRSTIVNRKLKLT